MSMTNIFVCKWISTYEIFYSILLTCTVSGETSQEPENIDEERSAQVSVAAQKTTEDPLPSIEGILPITGKYVINYI